MRVQVCFGEWYAVSVFLCVCVCLLVASGWVATERSLLARQARGRAMLGWRWKEALPGRGDDDSKCGGPLKSKQSRSDGESGGKEWWVTTNSAGGGVREGGGGGGGDGSGGGEGGMEKGKTTTWDDSSSSRVVMQRRRRMCGDGRGADARTHARTLRYRILLARCLASAERE